MMHELIQKAHNLHEQGKYNVILVYSTGEKVKKRIGKTADNNIIVMRTRKRGYYLTDYLRDLIDIQEISEKPINEKWEKSIDKAIKILESSGLWTRLLNDFKICKEVGYYRLNEAYKIYDASYSKDYDENQKIRFDKLKEFEPRLIKLEDGKESINYDLLWHWLQPLKIKKMYFGNYNEFELKKIEEALNKKEKIHVSGRASYDVSFEYNGENLAWYSEEYRNCGNGHYYLALSNKYAVYYEDD